jgi:hypothetical protein
MLNPLQKNPSFTPRKGPLVLAILDGVGFGKYPDGDAVVAAHPVTFEKLLATCPNTRLAAHGTAVGMPTDDDMGNSEVGHNAIGSGRVFSQGAKLVGEAVASGKQEEIYEEFGDLLFSCVNVARFLKVNPEEALKKATDKFINRFEQVEIMATESNRKLEDMTLAEMDAIWDEGKAKGL